MPECYPCHRRIRYAKKKEYFAHIPSPRISSDRAELASFILESKATKFVPEKFKDEHEKAVRKLGQRKAKGHAIEAPAAPERPTDFHSLSCEGCELNTKPRHPLRCATLMLPTAG